MLALRNDAVTAQCCPQPIGGGCGLPVPDCGLAAQPHHPSQTLNLPRTSANDPFGVLASDAHVDLDTLAYDSLARPFVQSPRNPQSFNRYSYVWNNPLSYIDPSGYFSMNAFKRLVKAAIRVVRSVVRLVQSSGTDVSAWVDLYFGARDFVGALKSFGRREDSSMPPSRGTATDAGTFSNAGGAPGSVVGGPQSLVDVHGSGGMLGRVVGGVIGRVLGGTHSDETGGKFANGALTAAMAQMLDQEGDAANDQEESAVKSVKVIDSTKDAWDHYINGNGETVELGPITKKALREHPEQLRRSERIKTGQTSSLSGNYGVDLRKR